jgi:predicted  nucleic acid-binding Zn-ribbon protein
MNISQRISEDKLNLANFQVKDYEIQLKEAKDEIKELRQMLDRFRLAQRTASIRIMKETQDLKNERTELQNENHTMVAIIADKDYELNSLRKVISDMSENLP